MRRQTSEVLYVQEEFINETEGYCFGGSDVYEAYTADIGKLFRAMQREYGRCTGRVYIDRQDGKVVQVGWTFQKRMRYEDCSETYLREVWVTVHTSLPSRSVEFHYANL